MTTDRSRSGSQINMKPKISGLLIIYSLKEDSTSLLARRNWFSSWAPAKRAKLLLKPLLMKRRTEVFSNSANFDWMLATVCPNSAWEYCFIFFIIAARELLYAKNPMSMTGVKIGRASCRERVYKTE